jgi:hypothetical protein
MKRSGEAERRYAPEYLVEAQACVMPDMHVPVSATASSLHTRSMRGSGLQHFGPACFAILRTLHVSRLPDKYLPRHHNTSARLRSRVSRSKSIGESQVDIGNGVSDHMDTWKMPKTSPLKIRSLSRQKRQRFMIPEIRLPHPR